MHVQKAPERFSGFVTLFFRTTPAARGSAMSRLLHVLALLTSPVDGVDMSWLYGSPPPPPPPPSGGGGGGFDMSATFAKLRTCTVCISAGYGWCSHPPCDCACALSGRVPPAAMLIFPALQVSDETEVWRIRQQGVRRGRGLCGRG